MLLFWLGFFALVALLLVLDLGVLHRKAEAPSLASALGWTIGWIALGLSFAIIVYLIYENHWLGADLERCVGLPPNHSGDGPDAAITYVSAYLLEWALSVDNLLVIALVFTGFKVPSKYQHRVLFWGILGAVVFRCAMLTGGSELVSMFGWVYYIFGGYLAWQGIKLGREAFSDDDAEQHPEKSTTVRILRRFVRIVDGVEGPHAGKLTTRIDGRFALTTLMICLIVVELTDVLFALDSVPAVVSVVPEKFVMVTSNVFAILGLRSMYFVLASAMAKFQYLKMALGVLLVLIGAKMILAEANLYSATHGVTLGAIGGILAIGVIASVIASRRTTAAEAKTA
jgi:tellurite resistance protein TerC|nr:TerC/Alx family metal homeostasis membrane protein [Kofleriaceae bacterium]